MEIERGNIVAATRFVIRELLYFIRIHKISVVVLDNDDTSLNGISELVSRLLCAIECAICHGIIIFPENSTLSLPNPWPILRSFNYANQNSDEFVSRLKNVDTDLGKFRLWVRHALMNKQLSSCLHNIIQNKDIKNISFPNLNIAVDLPEKDSNYLSTSDLYKNGSLLTSKEGVTFVDLLSDLNAVDFNFVYNDFSSFDTLPNVIDYRPCMRLPSDVSSSCEVLAKSRLNALTESLTSEQETLESVKKDYEQRISKLEKENARLSHLLLKQSKEVQRDLELARETFKRSSLSLDGQNVELEKRLIEENKRRLSIEEALTKATVARATLEVNIERLHKSNDEKENRLIELQSQNKQLNEKLCAATDALATCNRTTSDLQQKIGGMSTVMNTMSERCDWLKETKAVVEESLRKAISRTELANRECSQLRADLQANDEFTQNLQEQLDEAYMDRANVSALQENLDRKCLALRERDALITDLELRCDGQETSLSEMAVALQKAKLQADACAERLRIFQAAQWTRDEEVLYCTQCTVPFSISRRRHHCRNCGLIFCRECSSFKMPLASSSKPMRVCETCHNLMLERYSTPQN